MSEAAIQQRQAQQHWAEPGGRHDAVVKAMNRMRPAPAPAPAMKACPRCTTEIPAKATRCPHCTSEVP